MIVPISLLDNKYVLDFVFSQHVLELFPLAAILSPYIDQLNDNTFLTYLFPYLSNTVLFSLHSILL